MSAWIVNAWAAVLAKFYTAFHNSLSNFGAFKLPVMINHLIVFLILTFSVQVVAQQISDTTYTPIITDPAYVWNAGSSILIDAGHHNFHTATGRYAAFANLLRRDGYQVAEHTGLFTETSLADGKILVISNALHKSDVSHWHLPNTSAFTDMEIKVLQQWVDKGGRLFLIADHMPMGGAAKRLAAAFGFACTDGFAMDTTGSSPSLFTTLDGNLTENVITIGRSTQENISSIATFTGQAFKCPEDATSVINLDDRFVNMLPDSAWIFRDSSQRQSASGWSQGAYKAYGQGRIVLFGEAAMFTAQLAGPQRRKMGMNHPDATQNYQLLLNIIHWLDGLMD